MTMSNIARIEVRSLSGQRRDHRIAHHARQFLDIPVAAAESIAVYWIQSRSGKALHEDELNDWVHTVLVDPVIQAPIHEASDLDFSGGEREEPAFGIEVRFRPGVTDNAGRSATEAIHLVSGFARENDVQVYSGKMELLYGKVSLAHANRVGSELLGNELIEEIRSYNLNELRDNSRFIDANVPEVKLGESPQAEEINIFVADEHLERMSHKNCWALTLEELHAIQNYYKQPGILEFRKKEGLSKDPTDVEMEVLAQTWSEHCKHKIFAANIDYEEESGDYSGFYPKLGKVRIESLYKTDIKGVTKAVEEKRNLKWLISVFSDNAGIVRFDSNMDLCMKVETHNSPSALDPYGGSLTGIVGVNRDILGCGLGARPIANTDVFCFAPPNWPGKGEEKQLPKGLKHPHRILEGVHRGVEHGGNKSGIPTVNGAFVFHHRYAGKPLVYCGTIGIMPQKIMSQKTKSGTDTFVKGQAPGHHIIMAGGRIGKDGIHGATFSSMELDETAPATAVQIGDPITQKRLADFLIEARDRELFSSITDNGAGGLSSSVGEMAELTNGATIHIDRAPVKYPGLSPFELTVSESQERMTFAVPEERLDEFMELAKTRGVEATDLGAFTKDGYFRVCYGEKTVALLDLDFLHNGHPRMSLRAKWQGPEREKIWFKTPGLPKIDSKSVETRGFYEQAMFTLLSRWNICSKENLVRRYDHEVQAATVVKPFVGQAKDGPGDSSVIWLAPHGGEEFNGVAVGCGIQPRMSRLDTYLMAQSSLDEAVRNCVAAGGDPGQVALCDNFCWPDPLPSKKNPDAEHKLAQLVRACRGLYDLARLYGTPFVSGKDSMKNDFIGKLSNGKSVKISVPPTLLVTAMARVPDVRFAMTSDFKAGGDKIYLIGQSSPNMGGSELAECFDLPDSMNAQLPPKFNAHENLEVYRTLHKAIMSGLIQSCHDISDGGLLVALAESAIGGRKGVSIDLDNCHNEVVAMHGSHSAFLFNETCGRFIISVKPEEEENFKNFFESVSFAYLGEVKIDPILRVQDVGLVIVDASLSELKKAWKGEEI